MTLLLEPSLNTSFAYETDDGKMIRLLYKNSVSKNPIPVYPIKEIDFTVSCEENNFEFNKMPILVELQNHLVYSYKINNNLTEFLNIQNHNGISLVSSSFEFYCFLLALLFENNFYVTFMEIPTLKEIWINLWKASEYRDVMDRIERLKMEDEFSFKVIAKFLSNFTLRNDALIYTMTKVYEL
jgi:hypothetical protein